MVKNFGGDLRQQKVYFCPKAGIFSYNLQSICISVDRTPYSDVL